MIDKLLITCLQRNKRLVLPTLGAFIRKSIDGVGVVLVFVPFLNKDDGVLLNAFRMWAGVEESEARLMLEEYIDHIKSSLKNRGQYIIEGIGVLKYDANGSVYLGKESEIKKNITLTETETKHEEEKNTQPVITEEKTDVRKPEHITQRVVIQESAINETKDTPPLQPQLEQTVVIPRESVKQHINEFNPEQEYGSGLNSQFAQQPIQSTSQPIQQSEDNSSYRTVAASSTPIMQPQRRPGNVGAVYFTGDVTPSEQITPSEEEKMVINSIHEIPRYIQQQHIQQQNIQQQQPQQRTQQLTPQQRNSALYGSDIDKRITPQNSTPQRPTQHTQNQPNRPQTTGQRPMQQASRSSQNQRQSQRKADATFATKLVWTLAIVAIVLTVCVMIYAVLYGAEMPIDEIQIDPPTTEITIE